MSLSVSYNQTIDTAALREVTKQIFNRANAGNTSSALANADLTKFNRISLGKDLYKVDAAQSNKIAMANSNININLSDKAVNSLKYLNNIASASIFNKVEGKMTLPEVQATVEKQASAIRPMFGKLTETAEMDADKKGSNPFYQNLNKNKKEEKEINIFA